MRPHRWQPTRLLCPWDSPGKNTGAACHFLLHCMKVKSESEVAQSCSTLSNPMDCRLPGSSVHGIFQARVLLKSLALEKAWWGLCQVSLKLMQHPLGPPLILASSLVDRYAALRFLTHYPISIPQFTWSLFTSGSRAFSGLPTSFPGSSCQSVLSVEELMSLEATLIPEMGPKGQMLLPPIF